MNRPNVHDEPHLGRGSPSYSSPSSQWASDTQAPIPVQRQYDDGLEVAPSNAPEWVGSSELDSSLGHMIPVEGEDYKKSESNKVWGQPHEDGYVRNRPWYKRKLILGIIAAVVILAIGLGVGLGVGLTAGGSGSSNERQVTFPKRSDLKISILTSYSDESSGGGGNDSKSGPGCKAGFCSNLLSVNIHQDSLYIFGRSSNKTTIDYISYNGSDWSSWSDLGGTSSTEFISAPAAQNWAVNASFWRLDVFAVGNRGNTVYNTWLSDEEDWPGWKDIGSGLDGPIVTCAVHRTGHDDRLDVWAVGEDSGSINQTWWVNNDEQDISEEGFDGVTAEIGYYNYGTPAWLFNEAIGPTKTRPAVTCADSDGKDERYHDVMWYDETEDKAWHSFYTSEEKWSRGVNFPGRWIGEPSLFTVNSQRTDGHFFGVQEDHEMYHISWDAEGVFADDMDRLKGSVYSPPTFESDGGNVFDIVALGENGTLVHLQKDRSGWESEWEDLGIEASSAPVMRTFDDVLWIFALNAKGELIAWSRDYDATESSWKDSLSEGTNLRGKLTLEY